MIDTTEIHKKALNKALSQEKMLVTPELDATLMLFAAVKVLQAHKRISDVKVEQTKKFVRKTLNNIFCVDASEVVNATVTSLLNTYSIVLTAELAPITGKIPHER